MGTLTKTEVRLVRARNTNREGRSCHVESTCHQLGGTVFAVSGGRVCSVTDREGYEVGVILPMGNRAVEIILNWRDLYTVRRVRLVTSGSKAGEVVVEQEIDDIYCDNLAEVAYTVSCWK